MVEFEIAISEPYVMDYVRNFEVSLIPTLNYCFGW